MQVEVKCLDCGEIFFSGDAAEFYGAFHSYIDFHAATKMHRIKTTWWEDGQREKASI